MSLVFCPFPSIFLLQAGQVASQLPFQGWGHLSLSALQAKAALTQALEAKAGSQAILLGWESPHFLCLFLSLSGSLTLC
jgi:hypothetical protein